DLEDVVPALHLELDGDVGVLRLEGLDQVLPVGLGLVAVGRHQQLQLSAASASGAVVTAAGREAERGHSRDRGSCADTPQLVLPFRRRRSVRLIARSRLMSWLAMCRLVYTTWAARSGRLKVT